MSLLTIFTAPKPFVNSHIAIIQRNAIRSWKALGTEVEVILMGEETGLSEAAQEMGVRHIAQVARNASGTPLVSSLFELARRNSNSPLLLYVNADILLLSDVLEAARQVMAQAEKFLIVGQRWDLDVREPLGFEPGWQERLIECVQNRGRRHPRGGSDYFIFPRDCFTKIPALAIGRAGWDNWMIYEARRNGWAVVDASEAIMIVHQDHDYSHLPGGQPHYRLPETLENVRLGGGSRTIFTLLDTNRILLNGKLQKPKLTWKKFWREVEIFPLISLHSMILGHLTYAVFHPKKAYREFRLWLRERNSALGS
jgi:hypothetical protein